MSHAPSFYIHSKHKLTQINYTPEARAMLNLTILLAIAAALSAILGLIASRKQISPRLSLIVFVCGLTTQGLLTGWAGAALSAGVSAGFFLFLFFTGILGRSATFALPAVLALLPLGMWWAAIPGLLSMAIVSAVSIARSAGGGEVRAVIIETSTAIQLGGPDSLRALTDGHAEGSQEMPKVNLFQHLAYGFAATCAVFLLVTISAGHSS